MFTNAYDEGYLKVKNNIINRLGRRKRRFKDNGDGTVTDNKTGLMWSKGTNYGRMSWKDAMNFCKNLKTADYADWRLPNRFELESLLDLSQHHPALPEGHPFLNVQPSYYWSSSTSTNASYTHYATHYAWIVYMYYGYVYDCSKASSYYVWPVRGGETL